MIEIYKLDEINQTRFLKVPKELFENSTFNKKLNSDAKLLYALLLDRMELSRINNWVNEKGEIYLLYSRENIQEILSISKPTAVKAFKQLHEMELIKEIRQGLGKPNIIYIGKIKYLQSIENTQRSKFFTSGSKNVLPLEVKNIYPIDTNIIETDFKETKKKDNGANKDLHSDFSQYQNKEAIQAIKAYMNDLYRQKTKNKHPFLKPDQYAKVYNAISSYMDEWGIGYEAITDMMCQFLNSNIDSDWNINHFATEGIMLNRMYEVAY